MQVSQAGVPVGSMGQNCTCWIENRFIRIAAIGPALPQPAALVHAI